MKIRWGIIEWGKTTVPGWYAWYFGWGADRCCGRRWGIVRFWYDCPHAQLNVAGYSIFSWSTYRTLPTIEHMSDEYKRWWLARPEWLRRLVGVQG